MTDSALGAGELLRVLEAVLLAADRPLSLRQLQELFPEETRPETAQLREALTAIDADSSDRSYELRQVGSGYRLQIRAEFTSWVARLWEERPPRYGRALLETLALIAYRQPITRGQIEEIRGIPVNPNIIRTLLEREWVRVVGHAETPGQPELFSTTRQFLDYFNIQKLGELPSLDEIRSLDELRDDIRDKRVALIPEEAEAEPIDTGASADANAGADAGATSSGLGAAGDSGDAGGLTDTDVDAGATSAGLGAAGDSGDAGELMDTDAQPTDADAAVQRDSSAPSPEVSDDRAADAGAQLH